MVKLKLTGKNYSQVAKKLLLLFIAEKIRMFIQDIRVAFRVQKTLRTTLYRTKGFV